jgi:hypothetical protein
MIILKKNVSRYQRVIRNRQSKNRQYNGRKKNDKKTRNDVENIPHKAKDLETRTPLKLG